MSSFGAPAEADAAQLLTERIRSGLWLVLGAGLWFILTSLMFPVGHPGWVVPVLLGQIAVVSTALIALRSTVARELGVSIALMVVAVACFSSAGAGVLGNNDTTTSLLFIGLTMGSATLLPWGTKPQLITVAIATAALSWNLHAVSGSAEAFGYAALSAVAIAFFSSIYIAHELERHRILVARQLAERRTIEEALRLSKERYVTAVRAGSVGVWDWNLLTDELYLDPVLKNLLGYQDREVPNRISDWTQRGHPEDRAFVLEQLNAHLQGKTERYEFEHRLVCKDGTAKWFLARGQAQRNDKGEPVRLLGAETDITALKNLDHVQRGEAEVSAALFRAAQVAIAAFDTPLLLERLCEVVTEVLHCNRSHTWLLEGADDAFAAVAGAGDRPEQWEFVRAARLPSFVLTPVLEQFQKGDVADVNTADLRRLLSSSLLQNLGASRVLFMAIRRGPRLIGMQSAEWAADPPQSPGRRRIAQGIAQLASLGIEYARVLEELERANRLKSDFVATMSHELRTPLHAIIGYNDLVVDGDFGPLNDDQRDALAHVRRSARHLRDVIDGILDLSRLERGQLPLQEEEVRVPELITRIDEQVRSSIDKPSVDLSWDVQPDLPVVRTDRGKLGVVLTNVVANGLKFTAEGTVTVTVRFADDVLEFRVSDTGIGIPAETLPLIFEPFRQGERYLTRRHDGLGLGLYVVRRLLEVLGGAVQVESEVGRGSTFRITIPRTPNGAGAIA